MINQYVIGAQLYRDNVSESFKKGYNKFLDICQACDPISTKSGVIVTAMGLATDDNILAGTGFAMTMSGIIGQKHYANKVEHHYEELCKSQIELTQQNKDQKERIQFLEKELMKYL